MENRRVLRNLPRISYYEVEEPDLDEYIYCDDCLDYVYEYCAVHGHLLVVPDDKAEDHPNMPSCVPRAALTIPTLLLHIAPSIITGAGLGIFATLTLPKGVRFGPYKGVTDNRNNDSLYSWQIYDNNRKPTHTVDGADPNNSNWMRYINCSRNWDEQNLVAYQYKGQLYYRTIRIIPRYTELLVFYGTEFAKLLKINMKTYQIARSLPVTKPMNSATILEKTPIKNLTTNALNETSALNTYDPKAIIRETKENAEEKPFKCHMCSYQSVQNSHLKTHIRTHTGEKPFKCHLCSYQSSDNGALKKHIRTHTGEKPFKCHLCSYQSTRHDTLKTHIRTHTGEKPFKCHLCSYQSTQHCDLKRHIRTHTGEKPFKCHLCSYQSSYNFHLKTHIRTHTGEKPFKCHLCSYQSTHHSALKTHIRTHTGKKPFKCHLCSYQSTRQNTLKTHIRTHIGENYLTIPSK